MGGGNLPLIRFKGFTDGWILTPLSQIAKFSKGSGYSKNDLTEQGTPIILYGRLYTKYETMIEVVDTYTQLKDNSVLSQGNEIIIPASGETPEDIACASVVKQPNVILGGDLNIVKISEQYDASFTALSITYGMVHEELAKYAQGKTIVHLHNSEISKVSIYYPPSIDEQRLIASFFRSLDTKISLQTQRIEKLKQMKTACLNKMIA